MRRKTSSAFSRSRGDESKGRKKKRRNKRRVPYKETCMLQGLSKNLLNSFTFSGFDKGKELWCKSGPIVRVFPLGFFKRQFYSLFASLHVHASSNFLPSSPGTSLLLGSVLMTCSVHHTLAEYSQEGSWLQEPS